MCHQDKLPLKSLSCPGRYRSFNSKSIWREVTAPSCSGDVRAQLSCTLQSTSPLFPNAIGFPIPASALHPSLNPPFPYPMGSLCIASFCHCFPRAGEGGRRSLRTGWRGSPTYLDDAALKVQPALLAACCPWGADQSSGQGSARAPVLQVPWQD